MGKKEMYTLIWIWGYNGKSKLHLIIVFLLVGASTAGATAMGTSTLKVSDKNFREWSKQVEQGLGILDVKRFLIQAIKAGGPQQKWFCITKEA